MQFLIALGTQIDCALVVDSSCDFSSWSAWASFVYDESSSHDDVTPLIPMTTYRSACVSFCAF
jgi:hypothetical protein